MCQLCGIRAIASQHRWPKPFEPSVKDLDFLVETSHDDYTANNSACSAKETIPASLLDELRLLATALDQLEADREAWWSTPDKRNVRKRLDLECDGKKLTELHKINNATKERIEAMRARLGMFVKWSLGMNGGIWELVAGEEVAVKSEVEVEVKVKVKVEE